LSIIRCNLIVFEQDFVYASKDIDNDVKNALNVIFAYIRKDVEDDIASKRIKDVFNIEVERNVDDICEIAFNNKDCFVKVVLIHTIANIDILEEDNFASNIEDNIENVLMLIIIKRSNVELGFARTQV